MDGLKPPKPLSLDGNLEQNWKVWKNELKLFMVAAENSEKANKVKSNILLHCIGTKAREIYETFTIENDDAKLNYEFIL